MTRTLWVVSELYYPELTSTGHILTELAEGLAFKGFNVKVICGQPSYASRGTKAPWKETKAGVYMCRCWSTTLDKDKLFFKIINMATISLSIFFKCVFSFKKGDKVLVVTNPPSLPFFVTLASFFKSSKVILIVHDVYPDILVAANKLSKKSILFNLLEKASIALYKVVSHIVVIGRDMEALILGKCPICANKISFIPNWADTEQIYPQVKIGNKLIEELHLTEKFIIQYAGNMGYPHAIETILAAIREKFSPDIAFVIIGSGVKKRMVEDYAAKNNFSNIFILPNRPRSDQLNFLNACDVALISLVPGMKGVSVPSRTYNILAAGKAIIALVDKSSEVGRLVEDEQIGWVVDPNDPEMLAEVIQSASKNAQAVLEMGHKARLLALEKYSFKNVLNEYCRLLESL